MATNKNAQIRYQALDNCLGNWNRRYYIEDLVDACNEALYLYNGRTKSDGGVKKRQVQEDIKFLESLEGYAMEFDNQWDGHRKYYRYKKRNDSFRNKPINQEEIEKINDAVMLLKRLKGVPQFEWLDDLSRQLDATSQFGKDALEVVSFQSNPYLRGMNDWYKILFESIINKRVIDVTYRPFGKEVRTVTVSPYHLKQYNNRWFLIGKHDGTEYLSNFAIDRIEGIVETTKQYEALDEDFSFEDYFGDVVGVSVGNSPVSEVILHIDERMLGYIMSKPIHESQSTIPHKTEDGKWEVKLKVQNNYELRAVLRSFGSELEVIAPASLREEMRADAMKLASMYQK